MYGKATKMKCYALLALCLTIAACAEGPVGNKQVPEPKKTVDVSRYLGRWYEIARYENRFETNCEAVTAHYAKQSDEKISVTNSCHRGSIDGKLDEAKGTAYTVDNSGNAKLRVAFFWPFYGDYWVLDHAEDYSWSIVGEPSGRYLWIMARNAHMPEKQKYALVRKAQQMGYNTSRLYFTKHGR